MEWRLTPICDGSAFTATLIYSNLPAGAHTVEVTNANGCVFATIAAINNTNGPAAVNVTTTMDVVSAMEH